MLSNAWPDNTLFQSRLLVNLKDKPTLVGFRETPPSGDLDHRDWQAYWWLYNLTQFGQMALLQSTEDNPIVAASENVLAYYDEPYHQLVSTLIARSVAFGEDGSYLLLGEQGEQLAEAILGFQEAKIVVDPLSETDQKAFERAGYRIRTLTTFSLNDILL